jgi:hypothetical protein
VLFRVEANLRKYSTVYVSNSVASIKNDPSKFRIADWQDTKKVGGSICFVKEKGNVFKWLYIEIFLFIGQFIMYFVGLLEAYCFDTN